MAEGKKTGRQVKDTETWVGVRLPKDVHAEFKAWAAEEDRSISYIIRRLAIDALTKRKEQVSDNL